MELTNLFVSQAHPQLLKFPQRPQYKLNHKKQDQCRNKISRINCQIIGEGQLLQEIADEDISEEEKQAKIKELLQQDQQKFEEELYLGIYPIPGGPQNLFRALVQGHHILCGYQPMSQDDEFQQGQELRYKILDHMQAESDFYRGCIQEDLEDYIQKLKDPDVPPTELEITAATEVLQRAIKVYTPFNNNQDMCLATFGEKYEPKGELELYGQEKKFQDQNDALRFLCREGHYDLLLTVPEASYREAMSLSEIEKQ